MILALVVERIQWRSNLKIFNKYFHFRLRKIIEDFFENWNKYFNFCSLIDIHFLVNTKKKLTSIKNKKFTVVFPFEKGRTI